MQTVYLLTDCVDWGLTVMQYASLVLRGSTKLLTYSPASLKTA